MYTYNLPLLFIVDREGSLNLEFNGQSNISEVLVNFLLYLYNLPGHIQHGPGCSSQETAETGGWSAAYCSPWWVIVTEIHSPSLPPFNSLFSLYLPLPFVVLQPFLLRCLKNMTLIQRKSCKRMDFEDFKKKKQCGYVEIKANAKR